MIPPILIALAHSVNGGKVRTEVVTNLLHETFQIHIETQLACPYQKFTQWLYFKSAFCKKKFNLLSHSTYSDSVATNHKPNSHVNILPAA